MPTEKPPTPHLTELFLTSYVNGLEALANNEAVPDDTPFYDEGAEDQVENLLGVLLDVCYWTPRDYQVLCDRTEGWAGNA